MDQRNTYLYQIENDLKEKLTVVNGYDFTPVSIKRGIYNFQDFEGLMPAICFTFISESPFESDNYQMTYDDIDTKSIILMFYGYAQTDGYGKSDLIYQMTANIETFLKSSDMTYNEDVIINNIEIKEGGVTDPITSFLMETQIIYKYKE